MPTQQFKLSFPITVLDADNKRSTESVTIPVEAEFAYDAIQTFEQSLIRTIRMFKRRDANKAKRATG